MIKNLLTVIVAVSALSLPGCNQPESTQSGSGKAETDAGPEVGEVIARVNGEPITEETLTMLSEANRRANIPREKLIDDLIKHELLYQEAVRKNLESNAEVAQRLRLGHRSILSQAAMQDFILNTPISDAEIQKEYEQTFGGTGQEEFKARHILTKTEDEAKQVIQKLKVGGDFNALAKEHSTDPAGPSGGDLGWFSAQQMVAPFSAAVVAMKNGDYSQEPVQTQFGWHVILREESRAKTPPPLDSVKANIQAQLQRKAIENHLETLRTSAKIEMIPPKPAEPSTATEPTSQANDKLPAAEETPAPEIMGDTDTPAATESK